MPEKIVSSTTTHDGKVYLLKSRGYKGGWSIVSAEKLSEDRGYHVVAVGQEVYVKKQWREFVEKQKRYIATDYNGLVHYSMR